MKDRTTSIIQCLICKTVYETKQIEGK